MGRAILANFEQCSKRIPSCCYLYKSSPSPGWDLSCFFFHCAVSIFLLIYGACCWEGSKKIFCTRESAVSDPCRRYGVISFIYKLAAFSFFCTILCQKILLCFMEKTSYVHVWYITKNSVLNWVKRKNFFPAAWPILKWSNCYTWLPSVLQHFPL